MQPFSTTKQPVSKFFGSFLGKTNAFFPFLKVSSHFDNVQYAFSTGDANQGAFP